jgi:VanZ family protein
MSFENRTKSVNAVIRWAAITGFAACVAAVSVLSLTPSEALLAIEVWDKLQHVLAYLILAVTGAVAFPGRRSLPWLAIGLPILGCVLEAIQAFIPGRVASLDDAVANAIGVGLGLVIARIAGSRYLFG